MPSADFRGFRITGLTGCTENISNMFAKDNRLTFVKSVVEPVDFVVELANYIVDLITDPSKIGVWVWDFRLQKQMTYG